MHIKETVDAVFDAITEARALTRMCSEIEVPAGMKEMWDGQLERTGKALDKAHKGLTE